jgi:dephospho-CoA kinase
VRIGFTGAASTGKTTTAKDLEALIPERYMPSVARGVMESRGLNEKTALELTPRERLELQIAIFEAKVDQDLNNPDGIFDRTLIDQVAYLLIKCNECLPDHVYTRLRLRAFESLRQYDVVFYFPVLFKIPYESDGFRAGGAGYRDMQDMIMNGLLNFSRVKYRPVPYGTVHVRASHIRKVVETLRLKGS